MANSRYGYVRAYEQSDALIPNVFIVVRIDGRGFTKLTTKYAFVKPNDRRALDLMNDAAQAVMRDLPDLVLAYGQSDEFSFVFHKDCQLFERRASKLTTTIVSTFTANYVFGWSRYFPNTPLTTPLPSFDGRAVCYPSDVNLRDYLSWRQVDCHINNLYNTTFWALVQRGGMSHQEAERALSGTVSSDKNEILFSRFGINYNNEPEIFKKGSVLYRDVSAKTPPPLTHPQPKRTTARPMSEPLERTQPALERGSPFSGASDPIVSRGPTFLSTSTTPSPRPSPPSMSIPTFPTPTMDNFSLKYPQNFHPVSPPAHNGINGRHLPMLTPLPLPPPTLRPSKRPPRNLQPPNPTAHTNFSPIPSPNPNVFPTCSTSSKRNAKKPVAHSASASLTMGSSSKPTSKLTPKRSPSMSILSFAPPQIPLRISSIPHNAPPRKLSLPTQRSNSLLKSSAQEKEIANATSLILGRDRDRDRTDVATNSSWSPGTPPQHLKTMTELPSPPTDDWARYTRELVMGSAPQEWSVSPTRESQASFRHHGGIDSEMGQQYAPGALETDIEGMIVNPVIPASPPPRSAKRLAQYDQQHRTLHSAPPLVPYFSTFHPHSAQSSPTTEDAALETPRLKTGFATFDWAADDVIQSQPQSQTRASLRSPSPPLQSASSTLPPPSLPVRSSSSTTSSTLTKKETHKPKNNSKSKSKPLSEEAEWASAGHGRPAHMSKSQKEKEKKKRTKARIVVEHIDIIKDEFWERRPWILSGKAGES